MRNDLKWATLVAAAMAVGGGPLTAQSVEQAAQQTERSAERAGEAVERGAERTGEAAREAGREIRRETGEAVDAARQQTAEPQAPRTAAGGSTGAASQLPAGIASRELDDADDLRDLLESATEAAMTKGGFGDLVGRLNDQDRNRLGKRDLDDLKKLDGRIDQLRTAFRDKYGADFDIDNEERVYADVALVQGEVEQPLTAMRQWPMPATGQRGQQQALSPEQAAVPAGAAERPATPLSEDRVEAANLEQGREIALAHFPAQRTLPPLTVSVVGEVQAWKIDIPNHIDAGQLHQNLLEHLTYLGENVGQWPADRQQAERLFTHHVMMALYDVPIDEALEQRQQPEQR